MPEGFSLTPINGIRTNEVQPELQEQIELPKERQFSQFGLWADAKKDEWAQNAEKVPTNNIWGQAASYAG